MHRWLAAAALAVVTAAFLVQLGHGLWIPEETDAIGGVEAPWLDAAVERAAIAVAPSARGARTGHALLALAALVAVGLAARALARPAPARDASTGEPRASVHPSSAARPREVAGDRSLDRRRERSRDGWIAAALLVASPAFVLAGRSAAGGIAAVAPAALATWGLVELRDEPRRSALVLAVVGIVLAVGSAGLAGALAPLAAVLSLGPGALRVQRAEVPIAWIVAAAVALLAGLAGVAIAAVLGGRLAPTGPLFAGGGAPSLALGLAPLALLLPVAAIRRPPVELVAHAAAWSIASLAWPRDPWLRLAPAAPLALLLVRSFDATAAVRATHRLVAVAAAAAILAGAALAALAFQREPGWLAGAHLPDPTTLGDAALHFGPAGWAFVAIAAVACAALAVPRPVLRGAGVAGSPATRTVALGVAIGAMAALAWTAALHAAPSVSARRSLDPLVAAAAERGTPIEAALGAPARAVTLGASVRVLADLGEAIAMLDGSCRSLVLPLGELVAVERARRGQFVVLAATDRFAVATACPRLIDGPNADPLRDVLLARVPPRWGKPTDAAFAGLRLRAVKMPDRVARGVRAIDAAFAFDVGAPPSPDHRVVLRVDGCKRTATFEHALAAGALDPARLRSGDVVVHRVRLPLGDLPPCRYKLGVSWAGAPPAVVKAFELR